MYATFEIRFAGMLCMAACLLAGCGGGGDVAPPVSPPAAAPTIASVSPPSGSTSGGTLVAITGAELGAGSTVTVGGVPAPITSASPTQILASTGPHAAGAVDVVVIRIDGQRAARAGAFTYTAAAPPSITGISPPSDLVAGGATITVSGSGFASPSVAFGGVTASVTSATATAIQVTAPPHAAAAVDVLVVNADGQRDTLTSGFSYHAAAIPPPTLASVVPSSGPVAGGSAVTLSGTGFSPPVTVNFGGASGTVTGATATTVTVQSPPHAAGTIDVTLVNSDGQSVSLPGAFTCSAAANPPPSLASVSPTSGRTSGGTTVVVSGGNFAAGTTVTVGGVAAAVVARTPSTLTITTPPHGPGNVDVVVVNADAQQATLPGAFAFVAPPVLSSLSAAQGPASGGTTLTLTGTGFVAGATVLFGGSSGIVASLAPTSISATTPAHAAGLVEVSVSNPDGQVSTLASSFTFDQPVGAAPTVASASPSSGPIAGGTPVAITGANFTTGLTVYFGGVAGTVVGTVTATSFTAMSPLSQPAGPVDVTVVLPGSGLTGALANGFTFLAPAPAIIAMNVRGGPFAGGTAVLFAGSGLQASTRVTFGGVAATGVSYDPVLDRLSAVTPSDPLGPGVDGFVDVAVTNPDGQSTTFAGNRFHYGPAPVPTGLATVAPVTLATVHKGDTIVITGTDFTAAASPDPRAGLQVSIGGIAAIVSRSPTQIVVTAPKNNPGTYQVVVVNFDGQYGVAPGTVVYPGP
jgi:hypothetical protein